jgi:hypothetical protein
MVCHRCDNPLCVRPDHLFLGTQAENLSDMRSKDRHARGARNGHALLNEEIVRHIRTASESSAILAQTYGVSRDAINHVRARRLWRHVA